MKKKLDLKKETIATLKKEEEKRIAGGYYGQIGNDGYTNVLCLSFGPKCPPSASCVENGHSCVACW